MSKGLFEARRKLSSVATLVRQDKPLNAAQALFDGLQAMLREPLLKSEKEEFARFVENAVREINYNKIIQTQFSLQLTYNPGEESALLDNVKLLLETLEALAVDEADKAFQEREARKKVRFAEAMDLIAAGKAEEGKKILKSLATEYYDDASLMVEASEALEKAGHLEEAVVYMEKAQFLVKDDVYILNKLGILYRKVGRREESEKMFLEAERRTPDDPYLLFNKGRLYLDWQRWHECLAAAKAALALQPDFEEAGKMADYAAKRI